MGRFSKVSSETKKTVILEYDSKVTLHLTCIDLSNHILFHKKIYLYKVSIHKKFYQSLFIDKCAKEIIFKMYKRFFFSIELLHPDKHLKKVMPELHLLKVLFRSNLLSNISTKVPYLMAN